VNFKEISYRVRYAASIFEPRALALAFFECPFCGASALLRFARSAIAVRCLRCGSSAATLSLGAVLRAERPGFLNGHVYEMSARGPLHAFLGRQVGRFIFSEYFDDVAPGQYRNGVQCQDVQRLTYEDGAFDIVTSTEVFEHVPDDLKGFREVRRVLRSGGAFVFTVPLAPSEATIERAVFQNGRLVHLLPPAYHDDRIRGRNKVLVFRDYGRDIIDRLLAAGFRSARINGSHSHSFAGTGSEVVVAEV